MYLEFFIAGLTGFFFWLFIRHLFAFYRDRVCQKAGKLLRTVELPRKGVILRIAGGLLALCGLCGLFILQDCMLYSYKMSWSDALKVSPFSLIPETSLLLEFHLFIIVFLVLQIGSIFHHGVRLSMEIRENGLVFGFPAGIRSIPWERIAFIIYSPTQKRLSLQRTNYFTFLRQRFSVEDGEEVIKVLGQFVEIRDRAGNVLAVPERTSERPHSRQTAKQSPWRFFRFQFDLLSLLLLMLVVASAASWYGYRRHRSQPIKEALASLAECQPMVAYRDVDVHCLLFWGSGKKPCDKDLTALRAFPYLEGLGFSLAPEITDAGLAEVGTLTHLKMLDLMQTSITDAGLLHLRNLVELRELNLLATGITDVGLANLKPLNQLQFLHLSATKVTDAGLVHLQSFPQLEVLELSGLGITDEGLRHLTVLKNLRKLDLTRSKITDVGLVHLKSLSQLQVLNLVGTQISDAGLPNLYGLKNLKSVELSSTQVTPAGLALLKQALREDATIDFTPPAPPLPPTPMDESPEETEPSTVNDSAENHNSVMRYLLVAIVLLLDKME